MSLWIVRDPAPLCEPSVIPEIYVDAIGAIELIKMSVRVHVIAYETPLGAGERQRVVKVRLIGPATGILVAFLTLWRWLRWLRGERARS
jgi:hypothetical protein